MPSKCEKCKEIFWESEAHVCPSPEHQQAHDELVNLAALAEEMCQEWELEGPV